MTPIEALEARIRRDLVLIAHPDRPWIAPRTGPDGAPLLDVLVVGAGQSGIATAFGLKRARVDNLLVVDAAPEGREGPWTTYARMRTLRSPKEFTGPDLDIPSLTYRAWHEAIYGPAHWESLHRILKEDWNAYLLFVRRVVGIPVANDTRVVDISPEDGFFTVTTEREGCPHRLFARKLVLCTGQDSVGRWAMPEVVRALPPTLRAHTADAIDFAALHGKVVAVLGAGASAMDNAATALEAGARAVHVFCRRAEPQLVQPYLWLTFHGFLQHLGDLDDAWRWRFMSHIMGMREGFPQETWDRCARHKGFHFHVGAPWRAARADGDRAVVTTPEGEFTADFLICGTGVAMDAHARPELRRFAGAIATWGDRYTPPEGERDARLAAYPYLSPEMALTEKVPGEAPFLADIHLFSIASTMSFGPSGSSINAMTTAVPKLVQGITRGLFRAEVPRLYADLKAYDDRIAEVHDVIRGLGDSRREAAE